MTRSRNRDVEKTFASGQRKQSQQQKQGVKSGFSSFMELSKEPDPDGHSTAMAKLLESLYTMRIEVLVNSPCSIRHLARCAKQTEVFGALYRTWDENDDNADKWTFACTGYEESYSDYPDAKTWEEKGIAIFEMCHNKHNALEVWMENLLDPRLLADEDSPQYEDDWEQRAFLFGLVAQCPMLIFGYAETVDDEFSNQYWNKEDPYNPRLRFLENPLALIWLIATTKLGHPWADPQRDPVSEILLEEAVLIQRREDAKNSKRAKRSKKATKNRKKSIRDDDEEDDDDADADGDINMAIVPCNADPPPLGAITITGMDALAVTTVDADANMKDAQVLDPSSANSVAFAEAPKKKSRRSPPTKVVGPKTNPHVTPDKPRRDDLGVTKPAAKLVLASAPVYRPSEDSSVSKALQKLPPPGSAFTYSAVASIPPPHVTEEARVANVLQVDLSNLPFSAVRYFNVMVAIPWAGSSAEGSQVTITQKMIQAVQTMLVEAITYSDEGLTVLPLLSDTKANFCKRKWWICTSDDVMTKLKTLSDIKRYVDMSYDNGSYFDSSPDKVRNRNLKARMRFGSNGDVATMKSGIHSAFREHNGGCYTTPLQHGAVMKIGSLAQCPLKIDRKKLAHQLMKHINFLYPIAVDVGWPTRPLTDRKWSGSDPKSMGIFCLKEHAVFIDGVLSEMIHIGLPKCDCLWGNPFAYVPEARVLESTEADSVAYQLDIAAHFSIIHETIECPISLPGMLRQAATTEFGELTGLKFFWAIACSPDLPEALAKLPSSSAEDNSAVDSQLSADWSKVSSSKSQTYRPRFMGEREGQALDRQVQKMLDYDEALLVPSSLFTVIAPSEKTGMWLFSVRRKYLNLAKRVLANLPAFFVFHLQEKTVPAEDKILRTWLSPSAVRSSRKKGMTWDQDKLAATSQAKASDPSNLHWGIEHLLTFENDTMEVAFNGKLEVDLDRAEIQDFDTGFTVAGILNDIRLSRAAAVHLAAARVQLGTAHEEIASLRAQLAAAQPTGFDMSAPVELDLGNDDDETMVANLDSKGAAKDTGPAESGGGSSAAQP